MDLTHGPRMSEACLPRSWPHRLLHLLCNCSASRLALHPASAPVGDERGHTVVGNWATVRSRLSSRIRSPPPSRPELEHLSGPARAHRSRSAPVPAFAVPTGPACARCARRRIWPTRALVIPRSAPRAPTGGFAQRVLVALARLAVPVGTALITPSPAVHHAHPMAPSSPRLVSSRLVGRFALRAHLPGLTSPSMAELELHLRLHRPEGRCSPLPLSSRPGGER